MEIKDYDLRRLYEYTDNMEDVDVELLKRIDDRLDWLSFLEEAGVDNWEGCEFAIELRCERDGSR